VFNFALPDTAAFTPSQLFVSIIAFGLISAGSLGIAWVLWRGEYTPNTIGKQPWRWLQATARLAIACFATMVWVRMFASLLGIPAWLATTNMAPMQAVLLALCGYIFLSALGITLLTYSSLLKFFPRQHIWMPICISATLAWAYVFLVTLA